MIESHVLDAIDGSGFARSENWSAGAVQVPPESDLARVTGIPRSAPMADIAAILSRAEQGKRLDESEIVRLFQARGDDYTAVCQVADQLVARLLVRK